RGRAERARLLRRLRVLGPTGARVVRGRPRQSHELGDRVPYPDLHPDHAHWDLLRRATGASLPRAAGGAREWRGWGHRSGGAGRSRGSRRARGRRAAGAHAMSVCAARVVAHAKINLALRVLAREASGYHSIETIFARLAMGDLVTVRVHHDG